MSRGDIVAVASRLFSVYVLFNIVRTVPGAVQMLSQESGKEWIGLYLFVLVVGLFICAFLWFFPLTVARKLLPVMREERSEQSIDSSIALSLGLTLIGIWFLANGLIDSSYWLTIYFASREIREAGLELTHEQIANIAATVVELILAVWLLLGTSGIRRLIYKLRYGSS